VDPTFNPYLADEAVFGTMHDRTAHRRTAQAPVIEGTTAS
jgi:hypothetical protein